MKRNLLLPLVFLIICSMILGACQPKTVATAQPTAATAAPATSAPATQPAAGPTAVPTNWVAAPYAGGTKINFFLRLSEPGTLWPQTIDSFNKAFAGKIYVTMSYADDNTYKTKLPIVLRGDNPPDVYFSWEGGRAKALVDAGFVEPLDSYYTKYGWDKTLNPGPITLATINGKKYIVPYYMSASEVWYRPDILQKYNLTVPKTWDELQKVCQTLKDNGVYCWLITDKDIWEAQFDWCGLFVNKFGVDVYDQLINRKIAWTDPRVVDAFQTIKDFVDKGYVYPNPNSIGILDGNIPFAQGKVAFWYQGSWMPQVFGMASAPFTFDYFQFPSFPGVKPTQEVFAEETLMINSSSQHKDEAAEFINWVISPEIQKLRTEQGYFPALKGIDLSAMKPPILQKLGKDMEAAGPFTYMHIDHALSDAVAQPFLDALQGVLAGAITPADAAKQTEAAANTEMGPVVP